MDEIDTGIFGVRISGSLWKSVFGGLISLLMATS